MKKLKDMKRILIVLAVLTQSCLPSEKETKPAPPCNYVITIGTGIVSSGWCIESYEVIDGMVHCTIKGQDRIIPLTSVGSITIKN